MGKQEVFIGQDTYGNPISDEYRFSGDSNYTEKSNDIARRYNWNMMLYQNQYNDPSSQLQRVKDAGLNPLFYLGNNAGTTPAGAGGSMSGSSMTSASGKAQQILDASHNVADSLLETQRQAQQYDIARRQLNLEDRKVGVAEKQLGLNERQTYQNIKESESKIRLADASVDEIKSKISLNAEQENTLRSQQALQSKQVDEIAANIDFIKMNTKKSATEIWRMHKMTPSELENLSALTNLNYHQMNTEVEKMFNFMMDTYKKQQEIEVGKGQKVLLERQADGQIFVNYQLQSGANYADAEHEMKVVTGYWNAVNGSVNAIANGINATGSAFGNVARGIGSLNGSFGNTVNNPDMFAPSAPATPWWMQGQ